MSKLLLIIIAASCLLLFGCGDSTTGGSPAASVDVVTVGGLGVNALGPIEKAIIARCSSNAYVISVGICNDWAKELAPFIERRSFKNKLVLIGHSYGCNTVVDYSRFGARSVVLLVLLDPVGLPGVSVIPQPRAEAVVAYVKEDWRDPMRLPWTTSVQGVEFVEVPKTNHGTIVTAPFTIDSIVNMIKEIK